MQGFNFSVQLIRSAKRRSVSIQIKGNQVVCRAPNHLGESRIREFIQSKSPWVESKLKQARTCPMASPKKVYSGETYHYLGSAIVLQLEQSTSNNIALTNGQLLLQTPIYKNDENMLIQYKLFKQLQRWFRSEALTVFQNTTQQLAMQMNVQPQRVNVREYKSRWGCCTIDANITYNWRLIFAPKEVLDYVVVHELCHILEHNHSANFWCLVEQYDPNYKQHSRWLKDNGKLLDFQFEESI